MSLRESIALYPPFSHPEHSYLLLGILRKYRRTVNQPVSTSIGNIFLSPQALAQGLIDGSYAYITRVWLTVHMVSTSGRSSYYRRHIEAESLIYR